MRQTSISCGASTGAPSTRNRQFWWARIGVLALLLTLGVLTTQPTTSAHAAGRARRVVKVGLTSHRLKAAAQSCPECEKAYVDCLRNGGGITCEIQFDACEAACQPLKR